MQKQIESLKAQLEASNGRIARLEIERYEMRQFFKTMLEPVRHLNASLQSLDNWLDTGEKEGKKP